MHPYMDTGVPIATIVVWLVLLAFAIGGIVVLVRELSGGSSTPEEILRRRYAAGEIDETEFHRRLDELRHV